MTTDPVCGRSVGEETTLATVYEDRNYHFCSETCRQAFVNSPLAYLDKSRSATSTEGSPKMFDPGVERPSRT